MDSTLSTLVRENKYLITSCTAIGLSISLIGYSNLKKVKKVYEKDVVYVADFQGKEKDLPTFSPFILKVITILEYNNITYKVDKSGKLGPNPKGKLPFIRYNDKFVYDSHFIIEWLYSEFKIGEKMDKSIIESSNSNEAASLSHILKRFSDEAFAPLHLYVRWLVPECSSKIIPLFLNHIENQFFKSMIQSVFIGYVRKNAISGGIGKYSVDEIISFAQSDLDALSQILGNKKFFIGDSISLADISIFSILSQIYFIPVDTPLSKILKSKQNLILYIENVKNTIFTESKWKSLCL